MAKFILLALSLALALVQVSCDSSTCPAGACPVQEVTACERNQITINCAPGNIFVLNGFYGRVNDIASCPYAECMKIWNNVPVCTNAWGSRLNNNCSSVKSDAVIKQTCNGKSSCSFLPSNEYLQLDPCVGTYKIATVRYVCLQA